MTLSAAVILFMSQDRSQANPASRLATIESLAHRGTFVIDGSGFISTCDKVMIEGHYYSSKPPMLSVLSTGAYLTFSGLTGITFGSNESASIRFISLFTGGLPYLILLYFFYRFLCRWFESRRTIVLGLAVFTLNYIGLGYAITLNNHTPAAACLFISFYYAFLLRRGDLKGNGFWLLSGFLAGLGATFEFWGGLFSLAFIGYLASKDPRRSLGLFIPAAAVPVLIHFLLTHAATGSFLPIYLRPDLYRFSGGYWLDPVGIDAICEPKPVYFFHLILGHHGLLSMTPVFLLSFWSMFRAAIRRNNRFAEALTIGIPVVLCLLFLGMRTRNYGGVSAGLRWMIHAMPFLFLFTADWIDRHRSRISMVLLAALAAIGFAILCDIPWSNGGPWHNSAWHKYIFGLY